MCSIKRWTLTRPEHTFETQWIRGWPAFDPALFDLTWRDFVWPKWKKMEKFEILRGNFPNPNQIWLTRSDPSYKNFWSEPINNCRVAVAEWSCHQAENLRVRVQTPVPLRNLWPHIAFNKTITFTCWPLKKGFMQSHWLKNNLQHCYLIFIMD